MQEEHASPGAPVRQVFQRDHGYAVTELVLFSKCRESPFVDFSWPEVSRNRKQVRVAEQGPKFRRQESF